MHPVLIDIQRQRCLAAIDHAREAGEGLNPASVDAPRAWEKVTEIMLDLITSGGVLVERDAEFTDRFAQWLYQAGASTTLSLLITAPKDPHMGEVRTHVCKTVWRAVVSLPRDIAQVEVAAGAAIEIVRHEVTTRARFPRRPETDALWEQVFEGVRKAVEGQGVTTFPELARLVMSETRSAVAEMDADTAMALVHQLIHPENAHEWVEIWEGWSFTEMVLHNASQQAWDEVAHALYDIFRYGKGLRIVVD